MPRWRASNSSEPARSVTLFDAPYVPSAPPGPVVRVRMLVAYDGSEFHGFAAQDGPVTVAGTLRTAIERVVRHSVEITCAGGTRCFGPGDVLFAEDLTGEGHANRELLGPRQSLILPVPDGFDIRRWATAP